MNVDPKPRKDGKCVECGKPKKRSRRAATGVNKLGNHTRQNHKMWLIHLNRDAFCSRPCCERWHQIHKGPEVKTCAHRGCTNTFVPKANQTRQRFCSKRCSDYEKKAPNFNIPGACRGCGGNLAEYVKGCSQCADRRRNRARRANPEYLQADRARDTERRRRRREAARLEKAA